jgi:7-cyano-7-deazaguanine tRNA-ribosyltransferase
MLVVAGLSLKNLHPRVWDENSPYYLPALKAVMLSYGEFHQLEARRKQVMAKGIHAYLGISRKPAKVQVYLDNGAFYFLRQGAETDRPMYREFVKKAAPDWFPIPFDAIPTPQMSDKDQRACLKRTMDINRWYEHDESVPVIHVSRVLDKYIAGMKARPMLANKERIALGGIVPNLLRTSKAISYDTILKTLETVRTEFRGKKLHVFGIGGTATLHIARLLGMDSVDSSGWRNRAARGIVQLPGSGDRVVADLGKWRGRVPSDKEVVTLRRCPCPACRADGLEGLRRSGLAGFSHRATHNLHILLEEALWIEDRLTAGTYAKSYKRRLDNSVYVKHVERLVADLFGK